MNEAPPYDPAGLTEMEAARRLAKRGGEAQLPSGRSYASIVRANVFTVFNLILLVAGVATLAFGEWQDALFLGVLVGNSGIGIAEELRAKRALDRLAALVVPVARVGRDGTEHDAAVEEIVVGDLVRVQAGDQVVADGVLVETAGLLVDESILTGESVALARDRGEELRSGSFAVEGHGTFVVEAVGADSFAARLTGEAREFRHPRSPLELSLNRMLFVLVAVMIPLGSIFGYALWERAIPLRTAVPTAVAAVVTMVPEGLVLLASLTYAVATVAIARRGALAQQLNAVESLASVDLICLDKTGTLTEPDLRVVELLGDAGCANSIGRYAASSGARNRTLEAIAAAYPAAREPVEDEVPFTSGRRFGSLRLDGEVLVLGAPEGFRLGPLAADAERAASAGRRVLAFGNGAAGDGAPGARALVVLAEQLRPEARSTVEFFHDQGVELKVLSGDRPETVAAIAADAGILGPAYDGSSLPESDSELADLAERHAVIGRISPEGKRRVVQVLRARGRYVAMVGDGVNDVPALKASRLAIGMGTGTQMARSVADLVLVDGRFASVPAMVHEGRKILRNVRRVAKLFVTKSVFASFLILSVGLTPTAYPLLPRHLTLAASLTIGIPGFFLALAPSREEGAYRSASFLRELSAFAIPAGTAAGLGVVSGYFFALNVVDLPLPAARTVATTTLVAIGLFLIVVLEASGRARSAAIGALCALLAATYVVVLALPGLRAFFLLRLTPSVPAIALVAAAAAIGGLMLVDERFVPAVFRRSRAGHLSGVS